MQVKSCKVQLTPAAWGCAPQPRCRCHAQGSTNTSERHREAEGQPSVNRRAFLQMAAAAGALLVPQPHAMAVQGYTAGRIPGVTTKPDSEGYFTYTRPEGKQGGHGVGWSELPRYSFKVPPGWKEMPVSIADLGGTEIDLRFADPEEGDLEVVVAPVMRFKDIDFNANVKIEDVAPPDRLISGFALEMFGSPLADGDVLQQDVDEHDGFTYYSWEVKPHRLVSATAVKNRVILMSIRANGRQWRKSSEKLRHMWKSLRVVAV